MIYRFRVILDTKEDVFRDLEIYKTDTLEDFHNAIVQSFGFDGTEMASFYTSNDQWEQGEEITLFDVGENEGETLLMGNLVLENIINESQTKMLYIYDFFNMWTFFVELAEIAEANEGVDYPNLMFVEGQMPSQAPEKNFETAGNDDFDDDYDDEYSNPDEQWY